MKQILVPLVTTLAFLIFSGPMAHAQVPLNDAQLLGIVSIANSSEIEGGRIADDRADRGAVENYGKKMVSEHFALSSKLDALELKVGFVRAESEDSKMMKANSDALMAEFKNSTSRAFDRLYIDSQIGFQQDLLTKLDSIYLPAAANTDVKAYLSDVRATIEKHLLEARAIQPTL